MTPLSAAVLRTLRKNLSGYAIKPSIKDMNGNYPRNVRSPWLPPKGGGHGPGRADGVVARSAAGVNLTRGGHPGFDDFTGIEVANPNLLVHPAVLQGDTGDPHL